MGYETKIFVVKKHNTPSREHFVGEQIAMVDLCKCGDGPVSTLVRKTVDTAKKAEQTFALYPMNPERQQEAVKVLRDVANTEEFTGHPMPDGEILNDYSAASLNLLANDIEDGTIITDKYGDSLGMVPIDEFIEALKADLAVEKYRRYTIALALLESVKVEFPKEPMFIVPYGH